MHGRYEFQWELIVQTFCEICRQKSNKNRAKGSDLKGWPYLRTLHDSGLAFDPPLSNRRAEIW